MAFSLLFFSWQGRGLSVRGFSHLDIVCMWKSLEDLRGQIFFVGLGANRGKTKYSALNIVLEFCCSGKCLIPSGYDLPRKRIW